MNERFQTHSHSHSLCVSHSNLDLTIRIRMSVLRKVRSIGLLKSMMHRTLFMSPFERTEKYLSLKSLID